LGLQPAITMTDTSQPFQLASEGFVGFVDLRAPSAA
jgi:hypothetical protein